MVDRRALLEKRYRTGLTHVDRAGSLQEGGMKNAEQFEGIQFRGLPPVGAASLCPGKLQKTIDITKE